MSAVAVVLTLWGPAVALMLRRMGRRWRLPPAALISGACWHLLFVLLCSFLGLWQGVACNTIGAAVYIWILWKDNDGWKKLKRKLSEKVAVIGARLAVMPA
jgi:hypothetical protein